MRALVLVAALAASGALLVGCSSGTSGSGSSASPSGAASSEAPLPTESAEVLPPVMVAEGQNAVAAKVGNNIVVSVADPTKVEVTTDNPQVLEVQQGYSDGSANFNPGAVAISNGTAQLRLVQADGTTRVIVVTVT